MFQIYLVSLSKDELRKPYTDRLPCSILFKPASPVEEIQRPAVIYLHGWNGYPYSPLAPSLGSALASQGYVFLSLGMRRRGVEGQMKALPDGDLDDISCGVEYLSSHGLSEVILAGEGIGALSAVRYQSKKQDSRIKGIVLIRPLPDLATWLQNALGEDRYTAFLEKSESEVIQGTDGVEWVDLTVDAPDGQPVLIYQSFASWLSWWGPDADTRISLFLEKLPTPLLLVGGKDVQFAEMLKVRADARDSAHVEDGEAKLAEVFVEWERKLESPASGQFQLVRSDVTEPVEIVAVETSDGSSLVGFLWEGRNGLQSQTVVLHVRGKTGTPITEPLFSKLAEVYNQHGIAAIVIELRRSGYGGSLRATSEMDVDDIHAFVEFLSKRGYTRIILSGQSLGSNSIMRYQVQRRHPNIIALVHMAPTRDCAEWLEKHIGSDAYSSLVAEAKQAIQERRGDRGLIGKPPYQWMLSPQRPLSWLSWWGSEADTANLKTIAQVDVPILLLCGSNDFFNVRERLDQLEKAATQSPVTNIIWYEGCGHDFAGFERQTAQDIVRWLESVKNQGL